MRDTVELAEHVKKCIAWNSVWVARDQVATADNRLEFELPLIVKQVCSPAA